MKYGILTEKIISELKDIVGDSSVWITQEKLLSCSRDQTITLKTDEYIMPDVVVAPSNAEEVSKILKLANKHLIPVTPRGGGTGLSGGALPIHGGIVISDEKLNKIIEIDSENMVAVVEPGVVTSDISTAAIEKKLWYAGYPMSFESCHIGGNIAENAGGGNAVKYGVTIRYVLGLEVVMPTGEIVNLGGKLMKDVSGYNLKELIVGSEGTLGYVTKIILKLQPVMKSRVVLLVLFKDTETAISLVPKIMTESGILPKSIEFIDRNCYESSCKYLNEELPMEGVGAVLLIELDGSVDEHVEHEADKVGVICSEGGAVEIYVADNATTRERIWSVRRNVDEAMRLQYPTQVGQDTVVPIASIPKYVKELEKLAQKHGVLIPIYGHAGDGNLHPSVLKKNEISMEEWETQKHIVEYEIFKLTHNLGGAISGEHGIGTKRKDIFTELAGETHLYFMKKIKEALDPNNIMNPGKIF